ncbi:MAG TPA: hypothetical protein VGJ91_13180 [Polyangiaceae bacterium]
MLRAKALKYLLSVCALLCLKGCVLPFDDYPEGDLCAASKDAGIDANTAPDPALRGCVAGAPGEAAKIQEFAGTAGAGGGE